jgi:hypothetical protein
MNTQTNSNPAQNAEQVNPAKHPAKMAGPAPTPLTDAAAWHETGAPEGELVLASFARSLERANAALAGQLATAQHERDELHDQRQRSGKEAMRIQDERLEERAAFQMLRTQRDELEKECAAAVREIERWQKVAAEASAEREHNANQAQAWRDVATRLADGLRTNYGTSAHIAALSDFDRLNAAFDDPQLPSFTSAKINPESKP